jgi:nucleoside-diphosphate-sugar epimerase
VRRALVTGATGLVGSHIVERLVAEGWSVRTLVRDPGAVDGSPTRGVEVRQGDVLDARVFAGAANGCDTIFHAAGVITPRGGWRAFETTNIAGTRNAIAAAESAHARLLHVSSVAVYGAARYRSSVTDEATPLDALPERAHYARSKRESERLVMDAHHAGRIWAAAVRPDVIYGPRDRQFVPRVARFLRRGFAPIIGGGRSTLAIVHAAHVADGAIRAAGTDVAAGKAYNLANDFDVSVADFFRFAGEGLGASVRLVPVPLWLARQGLRLLALLDSLSGGAMRAVTTSSLDFVTRDNPFSSDLARRELGWTPTIRPPVGVPEAFRWWKTHR